MSQVYLLFNANNPPPLNSGLGPYCDLLIRARIFWYAHAHEGITTGLNGGRLVLYGDNDLLFVLFLKFAVPGVMMILYLFRALFPLSIVHQQPTASRPHRIHLALRRRPAHLLRQTSPLSPL